MIKITKSADGAEWQMKMTRAGERLAGYGFEVAIGVGIGYVIGHWLGKKYGWGPWGDFGGVIIGCSAGMYALVKEAIRTNKK